ncbi:MAG: hypothetical protein KDD46_00295 [Bdellovibrionales bacterium]|nr:hypothetical protein [Bdellovibrionales bacterium]
MSVRFSLALVVFVLMQSCGSTDQTLEIFYTGSNAFSDASVNDIVYCVRNVPVGGQGLDEDNNGMPDLFVYPNACGNVASCSNAKPAGCGFDVGDSGQITLGQVPLDFRFEVRAEFRDASGTILYCGKQEFNNESGANAVTVTIASGNCS